MLIFRISVENVFHDRAKVLILKENGFWPFDCTIKGGPQCPHCSTRTNPITNPITSTVPVTAIMTVRNRNYHERKIEMALSDRRRVAPKATAYADPTMAIPEAVAKAFAALVDKLPRDKKKLSPKGVFPVVYSDTETYVGLRRDRGLFSQYVYSMLAKAADAKVIPAEWLRPAPEDCTPVKPCSACRHCALIAAGAKAADMGLIIISNRKGTKGLYPDGRGYTKYFSLTEAGEGVNMGLLDDIVKF